MIIQHEGVPGPLIHLTTLRLGENGVNILNPSSQVPADVTLEGLGRGSGFKVEGERETLERISPRESAP